LGLTGNEVALEGLQRHGISCEEVIDIKYDEIADDDENFEVKGMIESLCNLAYPANPMLDSCHVDLKGIDLLHDGCLVKSYTGLRDACHKRYPGQYVDDAVKHYMRRGTHSSQKATWHSVESLEGM
jgi:hypothetical protein